MKLFLASAPDVSIDQLSELLRLAGKGRLGKILIVTAGVVPYGLDPKPEWVERAIKPLRAITNEIDETSLEDQAEIPSDLQQYDVVFVTGGNVFYLAYRLEETGFGDQLRQYIDTNGVYMGSSAGSVVVMDDLSHFSAADDPTKAPRTCPGLGVLDEAIVVHANHQKYASIMADIAQAFEADGLAVTTINDDQVLLVTNEGKKIV